MTVLPRLRAGSALWLLRHEARIFYYGSGRQAAKGKLQRGIGKTTIGLWVAVVLTLHLLAYSVMARMPQAASRQVSQQVLMLVSGVLAVGFTLMLSMSLKASVAALFERGDLDLLLSSPLSSRSIFSVRLLAIAGGVASIYLFFLTPVAHAGLLSGQPHWMSIYPTVLSMALISASLGMLLTLALVRWIGVRRTRVAAQLLGALAGAFVFLLSQSVSATTENFRARVAARVAPLFQADGVLGPDSLAWLPAKAMLGSPGALLLVSAGGVLAFWLTVRTTHRFFVRGVQESGAAGGAAKAPARAIRFQFRNGIAGTVIVKEWRLILRDPQLISQVLLQLLYLLPLFGLAFMRAQSSLVAVGAGLVFLCGSLSTALAWIIMAAEDAPDLLRGAPCDRARIRSAKLVAVMLPPALLAAVPLLWLAFASLPGAALAAGMVLCSIAASALIVLWRGRPIARGEFRTRAKGNFTTNLLEALSSFAWAGAAFMGLSAAAGAPHRLVWLSGAVGAVVAAVVILGATWCIRHRQE